eukprot:662518-Karenia_brevis.AAC.1
MRTKSTKQNPPVPWGDKAVKRLFKVTRLQVCCYMSPRVGSFGLTTTSLLPNLEVSSCTT